MNDEKLYCTDCLRQSLWEDGWDIWPGGEERQFHCDCDGGKEFRAIVYDWDECEVRYYGIYARQKEMEYEKFGC